MSDTESTPQGPVLPDKPRSSRTGLWIAIAVVAVAAIVAAVLLLPRLFGSADAAADEPTTVRLGTTDASQGHWAVLKELLAEEDIDLEIVAFDGYEGVNPALANGDIDINAFQHILYLANHNVNTGDDLRVVGSTLIVPLPLYSEKYESVDDIPDGARIAVPDDATNQGRALRVLEAAGLIAIKDGVDVPTPADIVADESRVQVEPINASLTVTALSDPQIAGAVVNNNFADDAGILNQEIFFVDPTNLTEGDRPYVNVIASRAGDEDNPVYQKVLELYHDPAVVKVLSEESGGTAFEVKVPHTDVRQWLADLEEILG